MKGEREKREEEELKLEQVIVSCKAVDSVVLRQIPVTLGSRD